MTYKLNDNQFTNINALDDAERYDYSLKKFTRFEEIYSLDSEQGWIELSSEDGEYCLPIWPHPDFAKAWATGEWSDCSPKAIKLDVWLERWTDGLTGDDTMVVIFPKQDGSGIVLSPEEFAEDLLALLDEH